MLNWDCLGYAHIIWRYSFGSVLFPLLIFYASAVLVHFNYTYFISMLMVIWSILIRFHAITETGYCLNISVSATSIFFSSLFPRTSVPFCSVNTNNPFSQVLIFSSTSVGCRKMSYLLLKHLTYPIEIWIEVKVSTFFGYFSYFCW